MMNGLALFLLVSSLVAAAVWSPTPDEEVIVKEVPRVVVVEFDTDGPGNTKISISQKPASDGKFKEASQVLPNLGQGLSRDLPLETPRELICDALGKCKHRIATKIGQVKGKISDETHEIEEGAKEAYCKAKEKVFDKTRMVEEGVKQVVDKAKDKAKPTLDLTQTIAKHVAGNISNLREALKQTAGEEEAENDNVDPTGKAKGAIENVVSLDTLASLRCVIHLLGFATSYGVCVWVTFVSSFVLAGALPNQQLGIVQSKIYPIYFRTMVGSVGLSFLGHMLCQGKKMWLGKPDMFQGYALLAALVLLLINLLYLEPRAAKVMLEKMKLEKEEWRGEESSERGIEGSTTASANRGILKLNHKLKKLNTYSSFLNILTLMALKLHLVYLSRRLCISA